MYMVIIHNYSSRKYKFIKFRGRSAYVILRLTAFQPSFRSCWVQLHKTHFDMTKEWYNSKRILTP